MMHILTFIVLHIAVFQVAFSGTCSGFGKTGRCLPRSVCDGWRRPSFLSSSCGLVSGTQLFCCTDFPVTSCSTSQGSGICTPQVGCIGGKPWESHTSACGTSLGCCIENPPETCDDKPNTTGCAVLCTGNNVSFPSNLCPAGQRCCLRTSPTRRCEQKAQGAFYAPRCVGQLDITRPGNCDFGERCCVGPSGGPIDILTPR